MAIEIVSFPIQDGDFSIVFLYVYQRVYLPSDLQVEIWPSQIHFFPLQGG